MAVQNDSRIKQAFREQRGAEEESMPSFQRVLSGSGRSRKAPVLFGWRINAALAMAVLAVVVVTVALEISSGSGGDENVAFTILEWESPTEFLLEYSRDETLSSVPGIETDFDWGLEVPEGLNGQDEAS